MGAVAQGEDKVLFFFMNFLIEIVTDIGLMISFWEFFLVCEYCVGDT